MSTGVRVALNTAAFHAQGLQALLWDACERIEVAGSIRRRRPDVRRLDGHLPATDTEAKP